MGRQEGLCSAPLWPCVHNCSRPGLSHRGLTALPSHRREVKQWNNGSEWTLKGRGQGGCVRVGARHRLLQMLPGPRRVTQSHVLAFLIEGARIRELNAFLDSVRVWTCWTSRSTGREIPDMWWGKVGDRSAGEERRPETASREDRVTGRAGTMFRARREVRRKASVE